MSQSNTLTITLWGLPLTFYEEIVRYLLFNEQYWIHLNSMSSQDITRCQFPSGIKLILIQRYPSSKQCAKPRKKNPVWSTVTQHISKILLWYVNISVTINQRQKHIVVWSGTSMFYDISIFVGYLMSNPFLYTYIKYIWFGLVEFYGISTIVCYLIPNPLFKYIWNMIWFG